MSTEIVYSDGVQSTEAENRLFERQYLAVMQSLSNLTKQKKTLEEQEKQIKDRLEKVMDALGIKSVENDLLKITRVAASAGKQTVDLDKLQKEEPKLFDDLLADYPKTTGAKKAFVRFDVK